MTKFFSLWSMSNLRKHLRRCLKVVGDNISCKEKDFSLKESFCVTIGEVFRFFFIGVERVWHGLRGFLHKKWTMVCSNLIFYSLILWIWIPSRFHFSSHIIDYRLMPIHINCSFFFLSLCYYGWHSSISGARVVFNLNKWCRRHLCSKNIISKLRLNLGWSS